MVAQLNFARLAFALAMLTLVAFVTAPAMAQEPVNPTARSVQEQQLLEALQEGQAVSGRVSIPNKDAGLLIKPEGRDWSGTHNNTVYWVSAAVILGTLALLAIFYFVRGRIRLEHGFAGRTIKRFNSFERFAHWMTAVCFILLALTGLNLVFGRYILLPLFGADTFASATQLGKFVHNYVAWPFMLGIAIMFLVWIKDNIPGRIDIDWIKAGGGMLRNGKHPPAKRFNAGQKIIFWAVVLGGAALSVTGVLLMFPELTGDPTNWQLSQIIHAVLAAIMVAVIFGHIYIGTLGMEGAFDAMGKGEVDVNWAREHHPLWVAGKDATVETTSPPRGTVAPAE
ncbi:formate dehydrogenase subunit gamma [Pararhizobium haloflavum]|uniref:formate dehydrogenase subunit gamma n=1 Tax=Pararhizobium haloflavum TaxID=2037914 RepID=UPI000C18BD5F|nr:formate dehydrogenase subunit gamma [Pararhizobium haloflavum]